MLEATLLFGGMGLHDQHSDLRLDVDNMSYEVRHGGLGCLMYGFGTLCSRVDLRGVVALETWVGPCSGGRMEG